LVGEIVVSEQSTVHSETDQASMYHSLDHSVEALSTSVHLLTAY